MLILNSLLTVIYRIELALFGRLSVFKRQPSSPLVTFGYGYGIPTSTQK